MRRYGAEDSTFSAAPAGGEFSTTSDPMTDLLQTSFATPYYSDELAEKPASSSRDSVAGEAEGGQGAPFLDTLEDWAERRSADGESGNIPRDSALPPGTPDQRCGRAHPGARSSVKSLGFFFSGWVGGGVYL